MEIELVNLIQDMPEDQPRLRLYKDYVVLDRIAAKLLDLHPGDYVRFATPRGAGEKPPIYVGKTANINGSFLTHPRYGSVRISSRELSRRLQQCLDGIGCYRVCPEDRLDFNGETYYNIFIRKYDDKEDSN